MVPQNSGKGELKCTTPQGLTSQQVEEARKTYGANEVKSESTPEWRKILLRYTDWVSLIVLASAIISATVPNEGSRGWTSFVLLIIHLNIIVWSGWIADRNAGNAMSELKALAAPTAMTKRDDEWQEIAATDLVPGDLIALKGGDVIPADAKLVGEGEPMKIDESSLTGESLAVTRKPGQQILSGAVVVQGELDAIVTATGANSFFGKTMKLLGTPGNQRGHLYKVLNRAQATVGAISTLGVIVILIVLLARGASAGYSVVTSFVILTCAIPVGMPVVTTAVLAVGARGMAKEKAIVARLSSLEELSGMEVLASDKTGTLTLNRLQLDKDEIVSHGGCGKDDVLLMASLSAKWSNNDAIDKAVTGAMGGNDQAIKGYQITKFIPFNPVDKKTQATVITPSGDKLIACKGAPQIIRDMLNDTSAKQACDDYISERASRGLRSLGVANSSDSGSTWQLVGLISLLDPPREDSMKTIRIAQSMGVQVKMVTGDQLAIAVETCKRLGLGTNIIEGKDVTFESHRVSPELAHQVHVVDGFAGVYPEHKHCIVEALQAAGCLVGMTGDGVNDAPALKKADVGIAVAGATSAARGAADIILTEEGIGTIITAIDRSRKIFRRLESYIIYRLASSYLILVVFFVLIIVWDFEMQTWALVLISMFNDLAVMLTAFDKVHSSDFPEMWNMTKCLAVALSMTLVGSAATIIFFAAAKPTVWNGWHAFDVTISHPPYVTNPGYATPGEVVSVMFVLLIVILQLNIILSRNHSFWWDFRPTTAPRPSAVMLAPVIVFMLAATFIGVYWPLHVQPDGGRGDFQGAGWAAVALTWAYAIVTWMLVDVAKVITQRIFRSQAKIKEECKQDETTPPAWVRAIDMPGTLAERAADGMEAGIQAITSKVKGVCACCSSKNHTPSKDEVMREASFTLSRRGNSGTLPKDVEIDMHNDMSAELKAQSADAAVQV